MKRPALCGCNTAKSVCCVRRSVNIALLPHTLTHTLVTLFVVDAACCSCMLIVMTRYCYCNAQLVLYQTLLAAADESWSNAFGQNVHSVHVCKRFLHTLSGGCTAAAAAATCHTACSSNSSLQRKLSKHRRPATVRWSLLPELHTLQG